VKYTWEKAKPKWMIVVSRNSLSNNQTVTSFSAFVGKNTAN
jgi:hypothetical protein